MRSTFTTCVFAVLLGVSTPNTAAASDCVILLHGLVRTPQSMKPIANALRREGYAVVNQAYPSRKHEIQALAELAIAPATARCPEDATVHFVTHSLGGILVRQYLSNTDIPNMGRTVMLAPPNQGSEIVDKLHWVPGFKSLNGPSIMQLGTDDKSIPLQLGPPDYEVGVIAGTHTVNPILSRLLPRPNDGKVSVASTKLAGMQDFVTVPYSHTFMMRAKPVISQVIAFLASGNFA